MDPRLEELLLVARALVGPSGDPMRLVLTRLSRRRPEDEAAAFELARRAEDRPATG